MRTSHKQIDTLIIDRAQVVMRNLLHDCLDDPMDPARLHATSRVQQMLIEDVSAAVRRLETP